MFVIWSVIWKKYLKIKRNVPLLYDKDLIIKMYTYDFIWVKCDMTCKKFICPVQ